MPAELLSQADGPIHRLTIDRPARRNALTPALARAIAVALDEVAESGTAELVVLRGAGGHFSAGLDLHWLRGLGDVPEVNDLQRGLADFQAAVLAVVRCPVPVLAVLEGTVAGFGLDLALACDLRLASRDASFTSAFARMGLVPDGGSTFTLPRLVGIGPALRLLLAGETIDAGRALAIGLVDETVEPGALEDEVAALASRLTAGATASVRAIKRLVRSQEVGMLEQVLATEGAAQIQALQAPEFRRRLEAFAARPAGRTGGA
jgi:2-(1,2-epoxy-1,2-dihydrophenyl)acetyl-CoA isomerase